jgi:hypothetical protein
MAGSDALLQVMLPGIGPHWASEEPRPKDWTGAMRVMAYLCGGARPFHGNDIDSDDDKDNDNDDDTGVVRVVGSKATKTKTKPTKISGASSGVVLKEAKPQPVLVARGKSGAVRRFAAGKRGPDQGIELHVVRKAKKDDKKMKLATEQQKETAKNDARLARNTKEDKERNLLENPRGSVREFKSRSPLPRRKYLDDENNEKAKETPLPRRNYLDDENNDKAKESNDKTENDKAKKKADDDKDKAKQDRKRRRVLTAAVSSADAGPYAPRTVSYKGIKYIRSDSLRQRGLAS